METAIDLAIGAAGGAIGGAAISFVVTGIFGLRAKRAGYRNEYHKMVLEKRMAAYERLEALIVSLKTSIFDEKDKQRYHLLFSRDDDWLSAYQLLMDVNSRALWLSAKAFKKTRDFNYYIYQPKPIGGAIEFGKKNYEKIAKLRDELEIIVAEDMRNLENVKRFLKQQAERKPAGFVAAPEGVPRKD
jgi:hypothetical protein